MAPRRTTAKTAEKYRKVRETRLKGKPTHRLPLLKSGRDPPPHFDPAHSPILSLVQPYSAPSLH